MGKYFWHKDAILKKLELLKERRAEMEKDIANLHVRIQKGNSKTGSRCYTVSLLPIIDCNNCSQCMWQCYDFKSNLRFDVHINDRCRNSVIHKLDQQRFWAEIDMQVKANFITELRINVGGDLSDSDFSYVAQLGRNNPKVRFLFFTKNYKGINKFLENSEFPENVHPIMSAWIGTEMENPYCLPEAHVLYEDGTTTAPEYGAIYCGGNCSECAFKDEGCWTLKRNEHVIFKIH